MHLTDSQIRVTWTCFNLNRWTVIQRVKVGHLYAITCPFHQVIHYHSLNAFTVTKLFGQLKTQLRDNIYIYKISSSLSYLLNFGTNQSLSFIIAFLNTNLLKNIVIPSWPITEQKHTRLHVFPQERIYSKASGHTRNLNIMPHTTGDEFKVTTFLSHGSQYCSQHV